MRPYISLTRQFAVFGAAYAALALFSCKGTSSPTAGATSQFVPPSDTRLVRWAQLMSPNEHRLCAFSPFNDVTVKIKVTGDNITVKPEASVPRPVSRDQSDPIVTISKTDPSKPFRYSTEVVEYFGTPAHEPSLNRAYALPFEDGQGFLVSQAGAGPTHIKGGDNEFAIDFTMPMKSHVYSARGGEVVFVQDTFASNGVESQSMDRCNYIIVRHDDGSYSQYAHLSKNGAFVRVGDVVKEHQLLALSGDSGQSSGPHLHFCVFYYPVDGKSRSVPVKFAVDGAVRHLRVHEVVGNFKTVKPVL